MGGKLSFHMWFCSTSTLMQAWVVLRDYMVLSISDLLQVLYILGGSNVSRSAGSTATLTEEEASEIEFFTSQFFDRFGEGTFMVSRELSREGPLWSKSSSELA